MKTDRLFETGLLFSLALHAGLWFALTHKDRFQFARPDPLEIDLTRPFRLTSNPLLARRAQNPGTGSPAVAAPSLEAAAPAPKEKPADWVLPGPKTKELVQPPLEEKPAGVPGGTGTGPGTGGLGYGAGGEVDWVYLTKLPSILNGDELRRNLRKFYPEQERRAGREGQVTLDIHIDKSGAVSSVDVVAGSGPAFDEAAVKVIRAARFAPGMVGPDPVPVKIRQTVSFLLEE